MSDIYQFISNNIVVNTEQHTGEFGYLARHTWGTKLKFLLRHC